MKCFCSYQWTNSKYIFDESFLLLSLKSLIDMLPTDLLFPLRFVDAQYSLVGFLLCVITLTIFSILYL